MNRLKDVPKIHFNTSFDPNQSCAIANVHIEGTKPDDVVKYLFDKHHIFTTPIVHEEFQGIRITPNIYTTLGELDRSCTQWSLMPGTAFHPCWFPAHPPKTESRLRGFGFRNYGSIN